MAAKETPGKIRNVGPKSAAWLRQVGVRTQDDLTRLGAVEAFMKVKRAGFRPSLNLLYALEGALADCHWADLPDERKAALLAGAEAAEAANPIKTRWQKQADRSAAGASGASSSSDDGDASSSGFLDDDRGSASSDGPANRFD
ncbi:TfoX/Sxy family protein [Rudaea cellulosilytica]|uniref:TfoX/Sxy family protein n=1 Tax=Rudaea cellulosilytica TaxID=540746 RepID=UPI0003735DE5|nr:TfoX/Sxy family protein [Rudaea cellulosilytica]